MCNIRIIILLLFWGFCSTIAPLKAERARMIVMSDIGGSDPDDQQSLVHLLTMLNNVDLEGFIYQHAWVPFNRGNEKIVMDKALYAYEKVWPNLCTHSDGYHLFFRWIYYEDPSSYKGTIVLDNISARELILRIPSDAKVGDTIHLILCVTDDGTPMLTHYRRVVVEIK